MAEIWMDVDTALSEVPVNVMPLIDDTDFKTIEDAVAYNAAGMALFWHFVTTAGVYNNGVAVTPTAAGDYDWTDHGAHGIYTIEIPASGGASINNDTEGFGWFSGKATGVLPWRGPVIGFRAAAINDALIDSAWSATRGLAGTALPNAAADAAGGLVISDAGGLDIDTRLDAAVSSRLAPTTAGRTLDVSTGGEAGIDWANVGSPTTTVAFTGTTIATTQKVDVETIKTNPCVNGGTVTFPFGGTIASRTNITAATGIVLSGVTHTGAVIPTVTTLTGHTAQTGDTFALANGAAGFVAIDTVVDAILADTSTDGVVVASGSKTGYTLTATTGLGNQTADITGTVSGNSTHNAAAVLSALGTGTWATSLASQVSVDDLPTNAELATALGTADDAVLAAIAALNDLSASAAFTAVLTTQLTESYAADGAAPTLAQAIFLIQQALTEFAISGTTTTIKKLDGSTTAATLTLDDGTTPTSVTRAT
jgi:hypothetical protein